MEFYSSLSLPPLLAAEFLSIGTRDSSTTRATSADTGAHVREKWEKTRKLHRAKLFALITDARPIVPLKRALVWASAILGVAAHDSLPMQNAVCEFLVESRVKHRRSGGSTPV